MNWFMQVDNGDFVFVILLDELIMELMMINEYLEKVI